MSSDVTWHPGDVSDEDRAAITGGRGVAIWMTGLSGSGKSTIARLVEARLVAGGRAAYVLDGDNLRHGLNSDLGFSEADRTENIRRVGAVSQLLADAGIVVLVPVIAPFAADRRAAKSYHESLGTPFMETFVDAPLEVCEERDPKGLYARARTGELVGMTGIDSPYEVPTSPDLRLDSQVEDAESLADSVVTVVLSQYGSKA